MKSKRIIALFFIFAFTLAFALTGCNKASGQTDDSNTTEVIVAAAPGYYPITFADDDGNADGYDVAVLKAIDELLPDYTFTFELASKETMNVGVQAGTYQIGINSLFKTDERLETYLMPENNLGYTGVGIIQREDANYNSMQDLYDQQARIYAIASSGGIPLLVNTWNEEHPDAQLDVERRSDVVYADSLASVQAGETDAVFDLIPVFNLVDEDARIGLKISDPIDVIPTYCIINKNETALAALIDEKLGELRENGTLSELSIQYFGYDVFSIS